MTKEEFIKSMASALDPTLPRAFSEVMERYGYMVGLQDICIGAATFAVGPWSSDKDLSGIKLLLDCLDKVLHIEGSSLEEVTEALRAEQPKGK